MLPVVGMALNGPIGSLDVVSHWVYILRCSDGSLYTGYTTDPTRRLEEHNAGRGSKYTRGRTPTTLTYTEEFRSKGAALKREFEIKRLNRSGKEALVSSAPEPS